MTGLLAILQRPYVATLLGAILVCDALNVSGAFTTRGCIILTPVPVIQTSSGLAAAADDGRPEQVVGQICYSLNRGPRITGPWAGTQRVFDPRFTYLPSDGASPTPSEIAQARAVYANVVASRFNEAEFAAAVRNSSPAVRTPVVSGYIHNSLALAVAIAFVTSVVLSIHASNRAVRAAQRLSRSQCPICAYPRSGLSPETPCPECGTTG